MVGDEANCYKKSICTHVVLSRHYNYTVSPSYHFTAAGADTKILFREYWPRLEFALGTRSPKHRSIWTTYHFHDETYSFQTYTKDEEAAVVAMLQPYSKQVWALLGSTLAIFWGIMNVCSRLKARDCKIIFWMFSCFMEQFPEYASYPRDTNWGSVTLNKTHLIRFLAISWVFIVLYLNNLYKGDLYSLMVSEKKPSNIPTSEAALFESNVPKVTFQSIHYNGKIASVFKRVLVHDVLSLYPSKSRLYEAINSSRDSVMFKYDVNLAVFAANLSHGLEIEMGSGAVIKSPQIFAIIGANSLNVPLLTSGLRLFGKYRPHQISRDDAHIYTVQRPWIVSANFFGGIFKHGLTRLVESGLECWWHSRQRKDFVFNALREKLKKAKIEISNLHGRLYSGVDEGLSIEGSPVGVGKFGVTLTICGVGWILALLSFVWEFRKELGMGWSKFKAKVWRSIDLRTQKGQKFRIS